LPATITAATPDTAPASSDSTAPADEAEKSFSYGESNTSILFLPDQVSRMKEAIRAFESRKDGAATPGLAVPDATAEQPLVTLIQEPPAYPVFYLSSIVYDAPNDWSLWMGGQKITSRKNTTEVTVLKVTRDSATFLWKPAYIEAIAMRKKDGMFAPTDKVKNKLSTQQRFFYDAQRGAISFTLRQNQSFAVGYFKMFEGFVDSPTLEPIKQEVAKPVAATSPISGLIPESLRPSLPAPVAQPAGREELSTKDLLPRLIN
jgi:hypothetical protein